MTDSTTALLTERRSTHGDWLVQSQATNAIKSLFRQYANWDELTPSQAESLDMIATKLGRIITGNPYFKDHWLDLAGYARLVSDRLET